jgi:hypothetical protein
MQPELSREVPQQGVGAVAAADPERVHSVLVRPPVPQQGLGNHSLCSNWLCSGRQEKLWNKSIAGGSG